MAGNIIQNKSIEISTLPSIPALTDGTQKTQVTVLPTITPSMPVLTDGTQKTQVTVLPAITISEITNGSQKTQIVDGSGNIIDSTLSTDGDYHLNVTTTQSVYTDAHNSSTTNLAAANTYTFTGLATSTLGVVGLQWVLKTDQNAYVYIEQSQDGTNWDISDKVDYYASKGGDGDTVQAIGAYWRIRVVLMGTTDTTYFRLQGNLCPMVEALPRSLNTYGRLKTSGGIIDEETGQRAEVEPLGSLKTISPVRLIGTTFSGTTKDTNFWTEAVTGSGSVTQSGEIIVATGVTANSTASYATVRNGRKVTGSANQFKAVARLITATQANNLRRIGPYNANDGFFFQVNGTTFGVGSRKATTDTIVNSGSFNGNYGASVVMDTLIKRLTINITELSVKFFVNDILLHTITGSTESLTDTLSLPIKVENNNSGGNTTNNSLEVRFACILRLGELLTEAQYKYIATNTTTICKYSSGKLQRIVNNDNAGTIIIYDNTAASGAIIASLDASKVLGGFIFDVTFSNGLTIVTAGGAKLTVIYE